MFLLLLSIVVHLRLKQAIYIFVSHHPIALLRHLHNTIVTALSYPRCRRVVFVVGIFDFVNIFCKRFSTSNKRAEND